MASHRASPITIEGRAKPRATFAEFVWIWNSTQGMETPKLHRHIARWLNARWTGGDRRLVLQAFRASGKSTLVGLFCAWLLANWPNLRILVLAAEQDLATKTVRNVKRVIERHPLTLGLKPKRSEQWAADQFSIERPSELRDPSMLARGIGANLTGSRADIIICDDVEVPNTCDTAPKRSDLRQRLSETDYILAAGGTQLYVGTPHSYYTIYADTARKELGEEAPFLDGFDRLTLPILTRDRKSRWPEKYPLANIESLRRRHGEGKFRSQMLLEPVNIAGSRLDPDRLRLYEAELGYHERNGRQSLSLDGAQLTSASAWWDPAYGAAEGGDGSVVACVFTDRDGLYWLHDVLYLSADPRAALDEARQQCRAVAQFAKRNYLPSLTVETNGIGRFLPGLLREEMRQAKAGCAVMEAHTTRAKETRILEAFEVPLAAGQIRCHRRVWRTSFVMEMREWRAVGGGPGGASTGSAKAPDDGLDAVAGCLLAEPVRLTRATTDGVTRPNWQGAGESHAATTDWMP